jgi:hypothetical protein
MKRLFTFGCSFTQYSWPTWADIIGREYDYFENWGKAGSGNHLILYLLSECILKNKLNSNDLVIIMWTNIAREDRYVNNKWISPGNIFCQKEYSNELVVKYADDKGYLITNLAVIHAVKKMLEEYKIPHIFTSMVNLNSIGRHNELTIGGVSQIWNEYLDILNFIRPSMFDIIFNQQWSVRTLAGYPFYESALENKYNELAGTDWPSFEKFKTNNFSEVPQSILTELNEVKKWNEFIQFKKKIKSKRIDSHPIPMEHLKYIETVIPEISISDSTKEWVGIINSRLLSNKKFNDLWKEQQHAAPNRW